MAICHFMPESLSRINLLYERFLNDTATPEEVAEFWTLLNQTPEEHPIREAVFLAFNDVPAGQQADRDWSASLQRILHQETIPVKRRSLPGRYWWAAAALLALVCTTVYFWSGRSGNTAATGSIEISRNDIAPGRTGAILTLANGSQVVLDSLGNGTIAHQNGADVVLSNGGLAYKAGSPEGEAVYNTISTPRGRQFQLTLADGTQVWLNAESSLTYPTSFSGKERTVQISGEAYFEVAKNTAMPFKVKLNTQTAIEVLGTHFNVNSYTNEPQMKTTLLEGSVKITAAGKNNLLAPGQQAVIAAAGTAGEIKVLNNVAIDEVMAWKNGLFNFENAKLEAVMRQISRWYDIEVVYENGVPDIEFGGKMGRDVSLSKVLFFFRGSDVHFRMEGKKLIVKRTE